MELTALSERYHHTDLFRVGDWVMPVASCNLIGHGQPHLVLRTQERVHEFSKGSPGSAEYGTPINIMVACSMYVGNPAPLVRMERIMLLLSHDKKIRRIIVLPIVILVVDHFVW